jgi:hypothetical protein
MNVTNRKTTRTQEHINSYKTRAKECIKINTERKERLTRAGNPWIGIQNPMNVMTTIRILGP